MIIGNGLLANLFRHFENRDVIIFASGISNSAESDLAPFQREIELLESALNSRPPNVPLIYFSTFSVFDPSLQHTHYILHKQKIEKYLRGADNILIVRLPIVLSTSHNPNTLVNSVRRAVEGSKAFVIHKNAYRYFISADDLREILTLDFIFAQLKRGEVNIAFPEPLHIPEMVDAVQKILGRDLLFTEDNRGSRYLVNDIVFSTNFVKTNSPLEYFRHFFIKYYLKRNGDNS
jgi:hypothetical protein